jgi:hypothetical protein
MLLVVHKPTPFATLLGIADASDAAVANDAAADANNADDAADSAHDADGGGADGCTCSALLGPCGAQNPCGYCCFDLVCGPALLCVHTLP